MKPILFLTFYFTLFLANAQVSLLKDLNGTSSSSLQSSRQLGVIGDKAIYSYMKGGQTMIISIQTNGLVEELDSLIVNDSYSYNLKTFPKLYNGKLVVLIGQNGQHLITTDGTRVGTSVIKIDGYIDGYSMIGTDLYYMKNSGIQKASLNTKSITSVKIPESISIYSTLGSINDSIGLFIGKNSTDKIFSVYRYNLINQNVSLSKSLGTEVTSVVNGFMHTFGNSVAFFVNRKNSMAIYISNGTATGTSMGSEFEQPFGTNILTYVWENKLFFAARKKGVTATNWVTLWSANVNGVTELQSANDDTYLIGPRYFTPFNGKLYFKIDGGGVPKLCYTDGTVSGTKVVELLYDKGNISVYSNLGADADKIYFGGLVMNTGKEGLFSYSTKNQLQNYYWGADVESFFYFSIVNSRLIFTASTKETGDEFYILGPKTPMSVDDQNNESFSKIMLYPNPAQDKLFLKNAQANTTYKIIDGLGREVNAGNCQNEEISIGVLPSGLYTLLCGTSRFTFVKE